MLQKLKLDLNYLQERKDSQTNSIYQLFIALEQLNCKKQFVQPKLLHQQDLFNKVRPEVIYQITEYLDYSTFLSIRLVSRRANFIIKKICPQKQLQIQSSIVQEEKNLDIERTAFSGLLQIEEHNLLAQKTLAEQQLKQINGRSIAEVSAYARPPPVVGEVIHFLSLLLDPEYHDSDSWQYGKKLLRDPQLIEKILSIKIDLITDKQLARLEKISLLNENTIGNISTFARMIYVFIKAIMDIRKSQFYIAQSKIKEIEKRVQQQRSQIVKLYKISKD